MGSYTYTAIQSRIADELNRTDLTVQIKLAIISAIEHYERQRFWWNETSTTTTTTASQNYIVVPTDMIKEYFVQLTVGGSKYKLSPVPHSEFLWESATSTSSGQPTEYSYYGDRFYLFPTPGSTYTATINYLQRLTTLSAGTDANGWTNFAEEMIRQRAKADLRCNIMKHAPSIQEAAIFAAASEPYLSGLEKIAFLNINRENQEKVTTGRVRPHYL